MIKLFLVILICVQSSWAFLTTQNNYAKEIQILKSFDISPTFLKDPIFISMQDRLDRYRTKHFLRTLEEGHVFIPILTNMIAKSKIPKAFLYLAMVESGFSAEAKSKTKAVGLWQFMPQTAKNMGLKINRYIDERRDPIKSTKVAIKYLKSLHARFGKWYLAALAYNCGEGALDRAIKEAGTDKLSVLISNKKRYLPKESRMYLRKIITMANLSNNEDFMTENNADHLMNSGNHSSLVTVKVKGGISLQKIADSIGMSSEELKNYNPQLKYYFTPPCDKKYSIYIPYTKYLQFTRNYKPSKGHRIFYTYSVRRGDSLYSIGKKFGIPYQIIKDFNHLKSNFLSLNKKLIIPSTKPLFVKYIVKKGDTLSFIAKKFKVKVKKIMEANNMKNTLLRLGRKIVIPD